MRPDGPKTGLLKYAAFIQAIPFQKEHKTPTNRATSKHFRDENPSCKVRLRCL
jgi:hypothetical protein